MAMNAEDRINAAQAILQYLRDNYKNITLSDTSQVLKIAQAAVYKKPYPEFFEDTL